MAIVLNGTTGIANDGGYTGDGVVFADTTPADTLVTTTGGRTGVGIASPATKFHVNGSGAVIRVSSDTSTSGTLDLSATSTEAVVASNNYGSVVPLVFKIDGSERARIDTSGNLLVGKTTNSTSTGAGVVLYGQSTISGYGRIDYVKTASGSFKANEFNYLGSVVGSIQYDNSSTAYVTSSDYRLKHDIAPMTGALAKVAELKPVTYKWKIDGSDGQGFIAHELQEVVPECVKGEKDGVETYTDEDGNEATRPAYQGIDTSFLVATLTAAIQEQQAIITALTARVEALEGTQP
jgi:hypothetical protein